MGPFFLAQSLAVTLQNISVLLRPPRPNLTSPSHTYNIASPTEDSAYDMTISPLELVSTQLPLEQLQPLDNVSLWLTECGLGDYIHTFKTAGYDDINLIKILNEEDLDAMGIDKPGTRKKILFYAGQLKQDTDPQIVAPLEQRPVASPSRPKGNSRANPYRCTKCCEYKIRSLDGKAHQCNPELIGHSWDRCPTQNLRQHPEERQRRKQNQKLNKSRPRKRKGVDSSKESSPVSSSDQSPEQPITTWDYGPDHYRAHDVYATGFTHDETQTLFAFEDHPPSKRMKTDPLDDVSQQVHDVSVVVMENYMSDELAKQLGGDDTEPLTQEELRHHHIDFEC